MALRKLSLRSSLSCTTRLRTVNQCQYCSSTFDPQLGHEFSPETENFPVYPQNTVHYDGPKHIQVGFLLARQPVVVPDVHPLEQELTNLLQNEYNVYNRHRVGFEMDEVASQGTAPKLSGKKMKASERSNVKRNIAHSSQNFWKERGVSLDQWGRPEDGSKKADTAKKDPKRKDKKDVQEAEQVSGSFQANFFNIEGYSDAQHVVVNNWNPAQRYTSTDFADVVEERKYQLTVSHEKAENADCSAITLSVPSFESRRTTCRKYPNFLYMLVGNPAKSTDHNVSLEWSIPYGPRQQGESLRSTLDRLLCEFMQDKVGDQGKQRRVHYSLYVPSNAPQGVFYENGDSNKPVYVFLVNYTEDHNVYADINTPRDTANVMNIDFTKENHTLGRDVPPLDFNWVSRDELLQYAFPKNGVQQLLRDISINGVGE